MLHMALMLCLLSLSPRKITLGFGSVAKNETNCQLPEVESNGDFAKMLIPTIEPFESRDSGELPGRKIGLMGEKDEVSALTSQGSLTYMQGKKAKRLIFSSCL